MKILTALLALLLLVRTAEADQLEDGIAAYEAKDYEQAMQILLPLADAGDAEAQYRVGNLYYFGYGVTADQQAAADWFELGAKQDHREAIFGLGRAFYFGEGRSQDRTHGVELMQSAANKCMPAAQSAIGGLYWLGQVLERNRTEGYGWILLGYMGGDDQALELLEIMPAAMSKDELVEAGTFFAELQRSLNCPIIRESP